MFDYLLKWCSSGGKDYRTEAFERQKRDGRKPLVDNPTIEEVRTALRELQPAKVLDIGCGWGRWMEQLHPEFDIWGCDVSPDMLKQVPEPLQKRVFELDLATDQIEAFHLGTYDVGICRGVLHYLYEHETLFEQAVSNMCKMVHRKIVVWEFPEVCLKVATLDPDGRFSLRPIVRKAE